MMVDLKRLCLAVLGAIGLLILVLLYVYNSRPSIFKSLLPTSHHNTTSTTNNNNNNNNNNGVDTMERRFPGAIIIGVRKGGTKALISMLDAHPLITAAKGEVHYFDRENNYEKGLNWYIHRMPLTKTTDIGIEKSPSYFIVPEVPKRIKQVSKNVKLILIVRDPVTRTISDYTQLDLKKARRARARPSIEKSIFKPDGSFKLNKGIIRVSLYDIHFKRWLQYFNLNNFLIVNGDQLISDPYSVLSKTEKFLQVKTYFTKEMFYFSQSKGFYCWHKESGDSRCLGSSKGHKHPNVSNQTVTKMKELFRPHMISFCKMANVTFTWCKI